ncbi:MAG TPA: S8 family serine peptidase [Polyangia bacterium]
MALFSLGAAGCHFENREDLAPAAATLQTSDGVEYFSREIIVRIRPGVNAAGVDGAIAKVGGKILDEPGPLRDLGYRRVRLDTPTADRAISQLIATSGIEKAERSYVVHTSDATATPPPAAAPSSTTPNDPRFGELWGMAKIGAPAAWDSGTGSASVLVAVSDTGVDYTHPDLAANVWSNPGEIPGNGKDDDGNGYVDDVHGWDFANNDADPMDDNGHGTHVSGTIGAVGNNGVGVAGVNWKVRIIGTKFLASNGSGSLWNGAQTILYAAKMHARVVNASWGCLGPSCYASYMEDALKALNDAGGLFMAAAGNAANDNDAYPNYPSNYAVNNVVAVAATDSTDTLARFSNWGATRVHLAAPGVGILSSLPGGSYASWDGTSMATPHVTGAAALFLAARPDATVAEVKQKLMDTADRVASLTNKVASGGRLNVAKLIAAAGTPPAAPGGFDAQPGDRSDVLVSWRANAEPDLAGYHVKWGTTSGLYTQTRDLAKTEVGTRVTDLVHGTAYYFVATAFNDKGQTSVASVEKVVVARDRTAPPQVVDLAAAAVAGGTVLCELVDSSGAFSSYWAAENAVDGTVETAWISPGRYDESDPQPEWLTTRLYMPALIDAVDLVPNPAYPQFFPIDFDVEVATDGETWTSVGGLRNAVAQAGVPVRVSFPPTLAAEVRLHVLRSYRHDSGVSYASIAELTIHEASSAPDRLVLSFTAPGDDPGEGRAASYDLRRSTAPLSGATFAAATPVSTGAPLPSGTPESVTVAGLGGETTYFFALTAKDEAGNVSPLSNVASATTLLIPPATITDLAVVAAPSPPHPGMVTLTWTAPGADGKVGQAARYDLRASKTPLTAGGFATAMGLPGLPAPGPAGTVETFAVDGLDPGQTYYFAIRAIDGGGAGGGVSNVVSAAPASGSDHTPPAAVGDLTARLSNASVKVAARIDSSSSELSPQRAAALLVDGDVSTAWMTTAADRAAPAWVILDLGAVQPLVRFRANPSTPDLIGSYPQDFDIQTSVDKVNWATTIHVEGLVGEIGAWNSWSAPVTFARYVRLNVTKRGPGGGVTPFVALGELEAYALTPELDADLTWVAPGDDGFAGTAARYDLRVATAPITDATFAAATAVTTLSPLHGGMIEVLHLPSLPAESTLYYALRAVDGSGNWSPLSNVATLTTPGIAPAPVTDLSVTAAATTSLTVGFTATGDDGMAGRATAYELRYAKTPISPVTWDAAAVAPAPAPQAAGARESVTVAGLEPGTTYYLAIKVVDDAGNRSPLSNVASGTTRDGTAPSAVTDLMAAQVDATARPPVTLSITDSTGSYSPDTAAANLLDANDSTLWISAGRTQMQPETVTFGLGSTARALGRLRMRAGAGYTDLFPVDFKVELQAATGGPWKTVVSETGFATAGGWEEWALGAVPAVAARLTVTKTVAWNGKLYAALGDLELYEDPMDYGKLRLSWTAPGDDGAVGTATAYDLRRAPTAISEASFGGATPVAGAPAPHPAGYLEHFDVTGLAAETTTCFALKAADEAGNTSAASNSACATTPGMPPATITDLAVGAVTAATATLTFTAPGADGSVGTAARYEVRRSTGRISEATWSTATVVDNVAAPHLAGTAETITVTGLTGLTTYRFAVRAVDAAGNAAAISNNAVGTTADDIPPARVTDLVAATNGAQGGSLTLGWTAPGDNGMTGQA